MQAIDVLTHEHRVIERGLKVLETITHRLERNERVPIDKLKELLNFFSVFADQCHHGKEEGILFPELQARGISKEGSPIGVMLYEHDEGRKLRAQMMDAVINLSDEPSRQRFLQAARLFIALLNQHIWKEDNVLFKMAEQILTQSDDDKLVEAFNRHEREKIK